MNTTQQPVDIYDTRAEQPNFYLGRPLLFPRVCRFEQLFAEATTDKAQAPASQVFGVPVVTPIDRQRGPMHVGPYCILRSGCSLWVRAHDIVAQTIVDHTLALPGDHMYFEIIRWSEYRALVTVQHSLILGGLWLAVIDPASMPVSLPATR